jgi:hypothetical protein
MLVAACLKSLPVQRFRGSQSQAPLCCGNRTRRWPPKLFGRAMDATPLRRAAATGSLEPLLFFRATENLQEETCLDELWLEKIQQPSQVG